MARVTDENVEDIIDAGGYGVTYWAESATEDQWQAHPGARLVLVEIGDTPDEPIVRAATVADIRRAVWALYRDPGRYGVHPRSDVARYIRDAFRDATPDEGIDCGMIDSEAGDVILQVAMIGKVIYG